MKRAFFDKEKWGIKGAKRSPLIIRMGVLMMSMICVVYICNTGFFNLVKLKSNATSKLSKSSNIQIKVQHCPQLHSPYLHYPKPLSFSREECECNPIRKFAIFSMQRSGSGWFESMLNSHMNISSNGEIFSVKERRSNASMILKTLDQVYNMDWFTSVSKNECSAAIGFKWMLN